MNYLPMNKLGAQEISPKVVQLGIFLPGVDSGKGYAVSVKIIHEKDQYLQAIQPSLVAQAHSVDAAYGDYWSGQIDLNTAPSPAGSSFGQPGRYVYRYVIHSPARGDVACLRLLSEAHRIHFPPTKLNGRRHLSRRPLFTS
jgi:maltooligosyltrehalose trehalohydrolase